MHNSLEAEMKTATQNMCREYAVLVRLSATEQQALNRLMKREALPGATVLRRLLMLESERTDRGNG
jgi:hypothetical protein